MSKISELSDGGSLVSSDYLIAVRSGGNVKVRMDSINVDQVDLGDNEFIRLGNSQDLTMVHTSTQSIINQAGIGDLLLQKAGATKLTINASGIDVTGSVTADGLTVVAADAALAASIGSGGQRVYITPNGTEINYNASGNSAGSHMFQTGNIDRLNIASNGDISFYNTAGNSQALLWDASAESLGIRTTSPAASLQVGDGTDTVNWLRLTGTVSDLYIGQNPANDSFDQTNAAKILSVASYPLAMGTANAYPVIFGTNDIERMRIDASGNVGIGTDLPAQILHLRSAAPAIEFDDSTFATVRGRISSDEGNLVLEADYQNSRASSNIAFKVDNVERMRIDASGILRLGTTGTAGNAVFNRSSDGNGAGAISVVGDDFVLNTGYASASMIFKNVASESMRLDTNGNLLLGTTGLTGSGRFSSVPRTSGGVAINTQDSVNYTAIQFVHGVGQAGTITVTATSTTYVTSSDQRLKENIADADDAGSKIDAIQVRKFDWKVDGSHQDYGMVAQELLEVAPEAVSAPEDPDEMMGVDYSKLVPMMLKEIQSLRARINALEAE